LLTRFQRSASDTSARFSPQLSCVKASPAISAISPNCLKIQQFTENGAADLARRLADHGTLKVLTSQPTRVPGRGLFGSRGAAAAPDRAAWLNLRCHLHGSEVIGLDTS